MKFACLSKRRFYNEKKQTMALTGNAGDNPAVNSLCTSPNGRGSYSNIKTCRGNYYAYPTEGYADAAYTDSCSTNVNSDATYVYFCPTDKHARANGYACATDSDGHACATDSNGYACATDSNGHADSNTDTAFRIRSGAIAYPTW